jgi:CheY-like chemotaxis protein
MAGHRTCGLTRAMGRSTQGITPGDDTDSTDATEPQAPLTDIHVLLVADDADCLQILQTMLEYIGAVVSVATSSSIALALLERVQADVVVSDLALPAGDGYRLIRTLRGRPAEGGGRLPAIALATRDDVSEEILGAGFTEHIRKPIEIDDLNTVIARLVEQARNR